MEEKTVLAMVGVAGLVVYGCVSLYTGHNGSTTTLIVSSIVAIIAGTIGFTLAKKSS